jgi:hypothetical protein
MGSEDRGGINLNPELSLSRPPNPQPYGSYFGKRKIEMLPWLLIINHHDTICEWFETKSEACVRAIEMKACHCEVIGVVSVRNFVKGKKVSSFNLETKND